MSIASIKTSLLLAVVLSIGVVVGWLLSAQHPMPIQKASGQPVAERQVLYWVAPMDPNYRRDKPGKSPMGMDLNPVYADNNGGDGNANAPGIRVDPAVAANLGMRTAMVRVGALQPRLESVGYVEYDERGMSMVHTRTEGWIERLRVSAEGDAVEKGEALFDLFSPKLVSAQREYLTALQSNNALLIKASKERLKSLGLDTAARRRLEKDRQVQERIVQYAPRAGVVQKLAVREGMFVMPGTLTLTLADLSTAWVQVEIFERDAGLVQKGQLASAAVDAYPGEIWEGRVDYVYPEVDPLTRTMRVRLAFDNEARRLKPNMFARVAIATQLRPAAVLVPAAAVIRSGAGARVVIASEDNRFEVVPVTLGMEAGGEIEVLSGLEANAKVVTSAQFLIDSEANVGAESSRLAGPEKSMGTMQMNDNEARP